jgi:uncharacterized protein (TIGR02266 family)
MMEAMSEERRRALRVPVQMFVEESHDHATYFQHSSNLSSGGIFLEKTIPHPVGTRVALQFTLPGDHTPIKVTAEIVNALESEARLGMGLKFVDLPPDAAGRIDRFVAQHEPH